MEKLTTMNALPFVMIPMFNVMEIVPVMKRLLKTTITTTTIISRTCLFNKYLLNLTC